MARKVRRARQKKAAARAANAQTMELEPAIEKVTSPSQADGKKQSSAESFKHEYAYVIKDLRRVIFLALAMFALLIALNLVLQ